MREEPTASDILAMGMKQMMAANPQAASHCTCPLDAHADQFEFHGKWKAGEQKVDSFKLVTTSLAPTLNIQRGFHLELSIVTQPLVGIGAFFTSTKGYNLILCIDMDLITSQSFSYERIYEAMEDETVAAALAEMPMLGVPSGMSVYIPFGHVMVVAGITGTDDPADEDAYTSFTLHHTLEQDISHHKKSLQTLLDIQCMLTKSFAWQQNKLWNGKVSRDTLQHWVDSWSPKVAPDAVAAAEVKETPKKEPPKAVVAKSKAAANSGPGKGGTTSAPAADTDDGAKAAAEVHI